MFRNLSPLTRARLQHYRNSRQAYISSWLLLLVVLLCLGADLIANDRPLLFWREGRIFVPVIWNYSEIEIGGELAGNADYTDPFVVDLLSAQGGVIWPPVRFDYDTHDLALGMPAPSAPDGRHWLGTDDQGRDVLARLLYGLRIAILFGLALTVLTSAIGIAAGLVQGYFGGLIDLAGQRMLEIWNSIPQLYVLIIMSSIIQPGFFTLLLIMTAFGWTGLVSLVRAEVLKTREQAFVKAAIGLGASDAMVMRRHVLPNALVSSLTFMPFIISGSLVALTSLDFLGFGLPPGSASLGELLSQGYRNMSAPWLGLLGFCVTGFLLMLLVFIGEGVRDATDPKLTQRLSA